MNNVFFTPSFVPFLSLFYYSFVGFALPVFGTASVTRSKHFRELVRYLIFFRTFSAQFVHTDEYNNGDEPARCGIRKISGTF